MAGQMNTYAEFAENDYKFFRQSYDSGNKGSALAALGQSICERYLKHIISECAHPENESEECAHPENESEAVSKESVLRTHSLRRLMRYISGDMGIDIPDETESALDRIDGFYFTTRYPGDDSFIPTERDIDRADKAVCLCRDFVFRTMSEIEQE